MVIWIIGLSGAGKSSLANEIICLARQHVPNVVLLDGDQVRMALGNDLGHSFEDRKRNADRLCLLGKFLNDQGIHVVCAVLSLFPESRDWNRQHIKDYYEVFIDTPVELPASRDAKGLYKKAFAGEIELPGVNMNFPKPKSSDLVIKNTNSLEQLLQHAPDIAARIYKT